LSSSLATTTSTRRHEGIGNRTIQWCHVSRYATRSQSMGRKLYVGNLPFQTDETELQDLFAQVGTVQSVTVMRDRATGQARGFAFVEMSTDEEAQKAITQLNTH